MQEIGAGCRRGLGFVAGGRPRLAGVTAVPFLVAYILECITRLYRGLWWCAGFKVE